MSYREKSAWMVVGVVVIGYGWYLTSVVAQLDGGPVTDIGYQGNAVIAAIAVVVLLATSHIALAAVGKTESRLDRDGAGAIKRYARSVGGVVVTVAAVLGMALAMVEVEYFWIANVILAGLVVAEITSAGSEILVYRRRA